MTTPTIRLTIKPAPIIRGTVRGIGLPGLPGPAGSNASATTDASLLVSGTLNLARLPASVAHKDQANTFTQNQDIITSGDYPELRVGRTAGRQIGLSWDNPNSFANLQTAGYGFPIKINNGSIAIAAGNGNGAVTMGGNLGVTGSVNVNSNMVARVASSQSFLESYGAFPLVLAAYSGAAVRVQANAGLAVRNDANTAFAPLNSGSITVDGTSYPSVLIQNGNRQLNLTVDGTSAYFQTGQGNTQPITLQGSQTNIASTNGLNVTGAGTFSGPLFSASGGTSSSINGVLMNYGQITTDNNIRAGNASSGAVFFQGAPSGWGDAFLVQRAGTTRGGVGGLSADNGVALFSGVNYTGESPAIRVSTSSVDVVNAPFTASGTATIGSTTGLLYLNNSSSGGVWQLRAQFGDLNIEGASGTTNSIALRVGTGFNIIQNVAGANITTVSSTGLAVAGNISMPASFAIGGSATSTGTNTIAIGQGANATNSGVRVQGVSIGYFASGVGDSVVVGGAASAAESGVAIGRGAIAGDTGVAIGPFVTSGNLAVAIGAGIVSGAISTAIGYAASAGSSGTALGRSAVATGTGTALGYAATAANGAVGIAAGGANLLSISSGGLVSIASLTASGTGTFGGSRLGTSALEVQGNGTQRLQEWRSTSFGLGTVFTYMTNDGLGLVSGDVVAIGHPLINTTKPLVTGISGRMVLQCELGVKLQTYSSQPAPLEAGAITGTEFAATPVTFAGLPPPSSKTGKSIQVSDRDYAIATSNGTNWLRAGTSTVLT